jgi:DNA modification methylase
MRQTRGRERAGVSEVTTSFKNPGLAAFQASGAEAGYETGTSIFDPVLCELVYRWFSPPGGTVLDPFAGGSVRGITASKLGRRYVGIDLSERQIAANRVQAQTICAADPQPPEWLVGDSTQLDTVADDIAADLVFSCPPYGNLEVYSDDPRDLSTMDYPQFLAMYRQVIAQSVNRLRQDRFACFVVGDFRGKDGYYHNFPGHTIDAFEAAGARLYNSGILVTAVGSLPVRAGKQFTASRKLGRTHQEVLIFCQGDWHKAVEACGQLDM